jgi:putative peptidoglycan lipid II flippase
LSQRIAFTSAVLLLINVLTATTGYLRELVLAHTFGAGTEMDAFYLSWGLILATHDLVFGAMLTATIVPILHRRDESGRDAVADPARFTLTMMVIVGICASSLAVVLRAALPNFLDILAPNMSLIVRADCLSLSTVLVALLPLNALVNLFVLTLNAQRHFILAGSVYLFTNVSFVVVLLLVLPLAGASSLSIASVAGPLIALLVLATQLARLGLLRPAKPDFSKRFFDLIWRQGRPILLTFGLGSSLGLLMVAHLMVRAYAANSGEGSVAALGYAFRLYEVPLSLFSNPAAVLMLPNIAIMYKVGSMTEISNVSRKTLFGGLVVLFPAAVVTWIAADFLVHILLQRGSFDQVATDLTAQALRGFAPAIVGEGIIVVFYRLFYAIHRPSRAVVVSGVALVVQAGLLAIFGNNGFVAIPLALSGGFLIGAMTLTYFMLRDVGVASIPSVSSMIRWLGCSAFGLATWRLGTLLWPSTMWSELLISVVFTVFYFAAILAAFAEYRRFLAILVSRFRLQLWGLFGSA